MTDLFDNYTIISYIVRISEIQMVWTMTHRNASMS